MNEIKLFYFPPKRTCQCKQDETDCGYGLNTGVVTVSISFLHFLTSCLSLKPRQTGQTQIRADAGFSLSAFLTGITVTISYSFLQIACHKSLDKQGRLRSELMQGLPCLLF